MAARVSEGAKKLASKGTQVEIAARLGMTQQSVSAWITGKSRPSGQALIVIKREYRIPPEDWYPTAKA